MDAHVPQRAQMGWLIQPVIPVPCLLHPSTEGMQARPAAKPGGLCLFRHLLLYMHGSNDAASDDQTTKCALLSLD